MVKKLFLMIILFAPLAACATGMKGSILPMDVREGVKIELYKFYPTCTQITPIEVVDIQPPEMKNRKVSTGDKWTEKWKISACGAIKVHPVEMQHIKVNIPGVQRAGTFKVLESE